MDNEIKLKFEKSWVYESLKNATIIEEGIIRESLSYPTISGSTSFPDFNHITLYDKNNHGKISYDEKYDSLIMYCKSSRYYIDNENAEVIIKNVCTGQDITTGLQKMKELKKFKKFGLIAKFFEWIKQS